MNANDYAKEVVLDFMEHITDHVFCSIQHDEKRMRTYMTRVNENSLLEVNQAIGKQVKLLFNLDNIDESDDTKSWLIKSYTRHKMK